jgi:hypothetical protein
VPEAAGDAVADVLIAVRRYSDAMVAYTQCLQSELTAAGGDSAPSFVRSILVARNNRAVAEHDAVTTMYTRRIGPLENLSLAEYVGAESRDCLTGASIVGYGVVNDGAVLFVERNRRAYLNVLETACTGLEREGEFIVDYQPGTRPGNIAETTTNGTPLSRRVCDNSRIYPYREDSTRLAAGCNLGRFYPISEDQATTILTTLRERPPAARD